jgi:DNA primase large subunit
MIVTGSRRLKGDSSKGSRRNNQPRPSGVQKLNLYNKSPLNDVSLEEFELMALARLQVLHGMETAKARGLKADEFRSALFRLLEKHLPMKTKEDVKTDNISHFILRLAYCQTEENRRWFLAQESALFRFRLENENPTVITEFLKRNNLKYEEITNEERSRLSRELDATLRSYSWMKAGEKPADTRTYFRVPFEEALELVSRRQALIRSGFAYVPRDKMVSIIVARFRSQVSQNLALASKSISSILKDERLAPLIKNMPKQYIGRDYSNAKAKAGQVTPQQLDTLSQTSMPLCMNHLHTKLKNENHLKHAGRMQYGLFLKGAGLKLEDALVFWKHHFSKKVPGDQFDKKYAYNIRHNYGKEGKRTDYTPYGCSRIISDATPGGGVDHGCPYKYWDEAHLSARLRKLKIDASSVASIVTSAKEKNYQVACRKHWEVTHKGGDSDMVGNHPNAWFEASLMHYQALEDKETAVDEGTALTNASSTTTSSLNSTAIAPAVDTTIAAE